MATFRQWVGKVLGLAETVKNDSALSGNVLHITEEGSSGTQIYAGYMYEEYLATLRGRPAADIFDQMRRGDPKIRMVLSAVKDPIRSANWTVQPAGSSELEKRQADLIEQIFFRDLDRTWQQQLTEILTHVDFGFSVFEVTHKVVTNHPKFGSYVSLQKLGWRSPRTIERWNVDHSGKLESISQYAYGDLERLVDIPAQYLLIFTNDREGDAYDGFSFLRPCYGPWKRKQTYLKAMAVGIEKYAIPTPLLEVPTGQESSPETARAKDVLKKWISHQEQWITYPAGYKLDFAKTDFDADPILNAIAKEDVAISHAFLENFLELGQSGSGSYALSYDLSDFFLVSIEHVAKSVCDVLNKSLIPDLVKMNFGPQSEYPKMSVSGIRDKPGKEFAEILNLLTQAKIVVADGSLEEDVRKRYGLPTKSLQDQRIQPEPGAAPPVPAIVPKAASETIRAAKETSIWATAADEKVCDLCDPLDGMTLSELSGKRPPLHENCRCELIDGVSADEHRAKKAKRFRLDDGSSFKVQAIDVSKKLAVSREDAVRIVMEFGLLAQNVTETEFMYRFEQCDPSLLVDGSLRSFEPMEGVTIYHGRAKPIDALSG